MLYGISTSFASFPAQRLPVIRSPKQALAPPRYPLPAASCMRPDRLVHRACRPRRENGTVGDSGFLAPRVRSELDLLDLPCAGRAGAQEKSEVGAGRHVARAHFHELGRQIGTAGEPADAAVLAALATGSDGLGIGLAHPRMVVFAGNPPIRQQIVEADQHHVDAVHRHDLLGLRERRGTLELHDDHGGIVERGIGLRHRKCRCGSPPAFDRSPSGGNLAARTTALASSAERMCGAITPSAPPASTREMYSGVLAGTRTNGAIPASSAAMQIWPQVSIEKLECSRST